MKIVTLKEAKEKGYKKYFTGKLCKHGHLTFRYVTSGHCHDCQLERSAKWIKENYIAYRRRTNKWVRVDREKKSDRYRKYDRKRTIKTNFGLTEQEYDRMRETQHGVCALCKESKERLNLDHCHVTGKLRKFLCNNCNIGLGNFKDSVRLLKLAALYLEEHSEEYA